MKKILLLLVLTPWLNYAQNPYRGATHIEYSGGIDTKNYLFQELKSGIYISRMKSISLGFRYEKSLEFETNTSQQIIPRLGLVFHSFYNNNRIILGAEYRDTNIEFGDGVQLASQGNYFEIQPFAEGRFHLPFTTNPSKWNQTPMFELILGTNIHSVYLGIGVKLRDTKYRYKK